MNSTSPQNVYCNQCGEEFGFSGLNILSRPVYYYKKEVKEYYFMCPHCEKEYIVRYASPELENMGEEMKTLRDRIRMAGEAVRRSPKAMKELDRLIKKKDKLWRKMVTAHKRLSRYFNKRKETEKDDRDSPSN